MLQRQRDARIGQIELQRLKIRQPCKRLPREVRRVALRVVRGGGGARYVPLRAAKMQLGVSKSMPLVRSVLAGLNMKALARLTRCAPATRHRSECRR